MQLKVVGTELDYKHQVAKSFGHAVSIYNTCAQLQQECARDLVSALQQLQYQIPQGVILEIGCGTGFITQELIDRFSQHALEITDISPPMLEFCQRNLDISPTRSPSIAFRQLDGEVLQADPNSYAAIVSGFVVQWFEHPLISLQRMIATLKPGGMLLISFPTDQSFPEWRQMCTQLNLPFTANALPNPQQLSEQLTSDVVKCVWYEKQICTTYRNAIDFFKGLKLIGAGVNRLNQHLSFQQMKALIHHWNQQQPDAIEVHHHIAFFVAQRR
jgi:malonyl-CoA O-methyltransferase